MASRLRPGGASRTRTAGIPASAERVGRVYGDLDRNTHVEPFHCVTILCHVGREKVELPPLPPPHWRAEPCPRANAGPQARLPTARAPVLVRLDGYSDVVITRGTQIGKIAGEELCTKPIARAFRKTMYAFENLSVLTEAFNLSTRNRINLYLKEINYIMSCNE